MCFKDSHRREHGLSFKDNYRFGINKTVSIDFGEKTACGGREIA